MATLISEILLKELPKEYVKDIHEALLKYMNQDNDRDPIYTCASEGNAKIVHDAMSLHDIAELINRLMKGSASTTWNMLNIFHEFEKLLDRCNDLIPRLTIPSEAKVQTPVKGVSAY